MVSKPAEWTSNEKIIIRRIVRAKGSIEDVMTAIGTSMTAKGVENRMQRELGLKIFRKGKAHNGTSTLSIPRSQEQALLRGDDRLVSPSMRGRARYLACPPTRSAHGHFAGPAPSSAVVASADG